MSIDPTELKVKNPLGDGTYRSIFLSTIVTLFIRTGAYRPNTESVVERVVPRARIELEAPTGYL